MKTKWFIALSFAFVVGLGWSLAQAENVIITPLGSDAGEFCQRDRAMILEDPSGVRILIQPGRTVDGSLDARLGDIHVVLLDHSHSDHIGDRIEIGTAAPGCDPQVTALSEAITPNIAAIAAAKNSAVLVGGELIGWLRNRIGVGGCGASGLTNLTEVDRASACVDTLRPGASRELQLDGLATGVRVSTVQATHSNGIPGAFISAPGVAPGLSGYGGTETGYVIRFSNGLSVYWSGDSGFFGDMKLFSEFYKVNLAIMHIGDIFTMGPDEAAFAVKKLIKPESVIPTHANERATLNGAVQAGTRTERFIKQVGGDDDDDDDDNIRVIVPLSGVEIFCNGRGRCTQ